MLYIEKFDVSRARVLAANARDAYLTNHFALFATPTNAWARFVGRPCDAKSRILGACARLNFLNSFA